MQDRLLMDFLAGMAIAGSARACSRAFAIDLDFAEGFGDLEKLS